MALIIGTIAAWIAWQQLQVAAEQRRVAQAKFNFDLFQRRYEIFEYTWSMLSSMVQARENQSEIEADFHKVRPRAQFLFGAEIADYMTDISMRIVNQQTMDVMQRSNLNVMRPEDVFP